MKNNILITILLILTYSGCSQKSMDNTNKEIKNISQKSDKLQKKVQESHKLSINSAKETIIKEKEKNITDEADIALEIAPDPDENKVKVVTKVKPKVKLIEEKKVDKDKEPIVIVEPVEDAPVEKVEIAPVVDDKLKIATEAKPTIGVVDEIPVEKEPPAIVVDPVVIEK
jgi:hypothetical protein